MPSSRRCRRRSERSYGADGSAVSAPPGQVVVELADELRTDLLVIGSHGYHVFERVLGTTAARIVNLAGCSVLVVRAAPVASPGAR